MLSTKQTLMGTYSKMTLKVGLTPMETTFNRANLFVRQTRCWNEETTNCTRDHLEQFHWSLSYKLYVHSLPSGMNQYQMYTSIL